MSEIYVNGDFRTAYLDVPTSIVPVGGSMEVVVLKNGVQAATISTVVYEDGRYSVTIPFFLVQEDGELEIQWAFNYTENGETYPFSASTFLNVVTPYAPIREIKAMLEDEDDFTDEDIRDVERATRHIINAFTGQMFGHTTATFSVRGNGKSSLPLPARLINLHTVNGVADSGQWFPVKGEGWYLGVPPLGLPTVRSDFWGLHQHHGGVIHNPNNVKAEVFNANAVYNLTGEWGWKRVPRKVEEAAKLLINDYATGDTVYRDRYLTSMTAADWRIQFHSGAFRQTGNVRADQLLNDYVLQRGWMVL